VEFSSVSSKLAGWPTGSIESPRPKKSFKKNVPLRPDEASYLSSGEHGHRVSMGHRENMD